MRPTKLNTKCALIRTISYYTDCHSKMLNITSRLAVNLRHFPEWNIDWADTRPQKSQEALSVEDFLPCEADARELKERAVLFVMRFLVKEISSLSDLKDLVPPETPMHPVQKTEIIPMCVLFKDEKYTSETVDILAQLIIDANLNGQPQVHVIHYVHMYMEIAGS
jgi:hypothetical protein